MCTVFVYSAPSVYLCCCPFCSRLYFVPFVDTSVCLCPALGACDYTHCTYMYMYLVGRKCPLVISVFKYTTE